MSDTVDTVDGSARTGRRTAGSRRAERSGPAGPTEFRVVVTHHNRRGPLGPYRLLVAVSFALLVAGDRIWSSIVAGVPDDGALVQAAAAGLFVWVVTTVVSNILGSVPSSAPPAVSDDTVATASSS